MYPIEELLIRWVHDIAQRGVQYDAATTVGEPQARHLGNDIHGRVICRLTELCVETNIRNA